MPMKVRSSDAIPITASSNVACVLMGTTKVARFVEVGIIKAVAGRDAATTRPGTKVENTATVVAAPHPRSASTAMMIRRCAVARMRVAAAIL